MLKKVIPQVGFHPNFSRQTKLFLTLSSKFDVVLSNFLLDRTLPGNLI